MTQPSSDGGTLWVRRYGDPPSSVLALHGFTLHGGSLQPFATQLGETVLAPDLPGHGRTNIDPISMETAILAVCNLLAESEIPPMLLGYSQGGRIALEVALARPELVSSLVLISTSPGLGPRERSLRRVADDALASRIERIGTERFIDEWLANPMTATDRVSPEQRKADRNIRLENTATGLAAALRGMGQASIPDLREHLSELTMPICLVAGSNDAKYAGLAREMGTSVGTDPVIVPGAGHNVLLEQPKAVVVEVRRLLNRQTD